MTDDLAAQILTQRYEREQEEERQSLHRLLGDLKRGQERAKRKRSLRPSERAMMFAEYQRDIEALTRIRDKHYPIEV